MPNATLTTLASNAHIQLIGDMEGMINPPWIMARCHREEVLDLLKTLDAADKAACEQVKQAKVVD